MPKKRALKFDSKPSSPAHPSLASVRPNDAPHSLTSSGVASGNSVNDQIRKLRLDEGHSPSLTVARASLYSPPNPSLPPSLRNILQLPDAPTPRPRPSLRVSGGRRVPGPAAPQSWLRGAQYQAQRTKRRISTVQDGVVAHVEPLPDAYLPKHGSLIATTLKALAKNWDWHQVYDQYYIPMIPVRYKEALLHYIVELGESGIDKAGLELLFQDEHELEGATGVEGLTHLDLARSIGHPLRFSDLKAILNIQQQAISPSTNDVDNVPESWDATSSPIHPPLPTSSFSALTHLSLAHPHPSISAPWKHLLSLAPHLPPTLTHLSLAYWPSPAVTPHSTTSYQSTPAGEVSASASTFYSRTLDGDFSEGGSILRRLSKSTYCLQSLDVRGCAEWAQAFAQDQVDWMGTWRALEAVMISQLCLMPDCLSQGSQRSWRDVWSNRPMSQWGDEQRQLWRWARREKLVMEVEKDINTKIAYRGITHGISEEDFPGSDLLFRHARSVVERDGYYWQSAKTRSLSPGHQQVRTSRVKFDLGWDDWAIREAVEKIATSDVMF